MGRPAQRIAWLGLLLAAPLSAGPVYLPVLDENGAGGVQRITDVVIANTGTTFGHYEVLSFAPDSDGTVRPTAPVPGGLHKGLATRLESIGVGGSSALLEIAADSQLAVEARLRTVSVDRTRTTESVVPVISSDNFLAAGATARLIGLYRDPVTGDASDFSVVNLEHQASTCTIKTILANGTQVGVTAAIVMKPLSLRNFSDVFGLLGQTTVINGRSDISCSGRFFAFAAITRRDRAETEWVTPAATGASTLVLPGDAPPPPPPSGGLVFRADGLIHTPSNSNPKRVLSIPVQGALSLRRLVLDMDFTPGPWNLVKIPGNHAIFYMHRGKFRSNTVGNVNAFGPNKFTIKAAQNINMGAATQTDDEGGIQLIQGTKYHVKYTYNAEGGSATCVVSQGGATILTLSYTVTSGSRLAIPATGLTIEFGHLANQEGPEVASLGWSYWDLRVELVQ